MPKPKSYIYKIIAISSKARHRVEVKCFRVDSAVASMSGANDLDWSRLGFLPDVQQMENAKLNWFEEVKTMIELEFKKYNETIDFIKIYEEDLF